MASRETGGGSFLWPVLLILAGLFFLAQNLGWIQMDAWTAVTTFWPLVLVAIGLDLILGRANPWLSALVTGAVVAAVVGAVALGWLGGFGPGPAAAAAHTVSVPLEGAERAVVRLDFDVGRLSLEAAGPGTANLLEGRIRSQRSPDLRTSRAGDRIEVSLDSGGLRGPFFFGRGGREEWDIFLSPDLPLELHLKTDVSESDLDLSGLRVVRLELDMDVGNGDLVLPAAIDQTEARIKVDVANLDVVVPPGVAARIEATSDLASVDVDEDRFPRRDGGYASPNYDAATHRIDLAIDADVGSVSVR